ncbi:MAG: hypothetical protein ACREK7_00490 [Gemmatimonadota bacterium]
MPGTTALPFAVPDPVGVRAGEGPEKGVAENLVVRFGADSLPLPPMPDTLTFPERALVELRRLDESVTPIEWVAEFPEDVVTRFQPGAVEWRSFQDLPLQGRWCVRARRRIPLPRGETALRTAFFYPPPMPDPVVLPAVRDTLGLDLTDCRLGAIWVETSLQGSPKEFEGTVRLVTGERGEPDPDTELGWYSQVWEDYASWDGGKERCVVFDGAGLELEGMGAGCWSSLARPGLEVAGLDAIAERLGIPDLRRMLLNLGLLNAQSETLFDLMLEWESANKKGSALDLSLEELAGALESWLRTADSLALPERAGVLLVADRLLVLPRGYAMTAPETPAERRVLERLEALGAEIRRFELSVQPVYTGNLLEEAWRLDPEGPVGERAFAYDIATGFAPPDSFEAYAEVIERAEAFLRRASDPQIRARVHRAVARGYGDIVALAGEAIWESNYLEGEPYVTRAPLARRRAIDHYEAALKILGSGQEGDEIWDEAWRLAAGLPPIEGHYVFIVP